MVTASFFAATQVMHPASHLEARLSSSSNVRSWPIADRFWPIADVEAGELAGSVLVSAFDPKRTLVIRQRVRQLRQVRPGGSLCTT